jgi:hypothetical protein
MQTGLFTLTPCKCGEDPMVCEYGDEVRIVGWCACPVEEVIIVSAPTYAESKVLWEAELCQ